MLPHALAMFRYAIKSALLPAEGRVKSIREEETSPQSIGGSLRGRASLLLQQDAMAAEEVTLGGGSEA